MSESDFMEDAIALVVMISAMELDLVVLLLMQITDYTLAIAALLSNQRPNTRLRPTIFPGTFDIGNYSDANAREDFRFTCEELKMLRLALHIPDVFRTEAGDVVDGDVALAMLCYRLSYPGKLSRLRKLFGRSDPSFCRICLDLVDFLDCEWEQILYFNEEVFMNNHQRYCDAVKTKTDGVVDGISLFIDGTKCAICRPSAQARSRLQEVLDGVAVDDHVNLQKACYNGHKRKHCLNYQAVNAPDGMSLIGCRHL